MTQQWSVDQPRTLDLGQVEKVKVRVVGGHVDVVATDGPAVLEVTDLHGPPLEVRLDGTTLELTYDDLSWRGLLSWVTGGGRRSVRLSLAVPPSCPVELGVVSASAVVAGMEGSATVKSVSGDVTLDGTAGSVECETVSGDLEARSLAGDLAFKSVSGDLTVVGGECRAVQAKTVSGEVTLDLVTRGEHRLDVESVSGDVTVRLPEDTDLEVDVRTTSGDVDSAFYGLHRVRKPGRSHLGGTLGGGGGHLAARTVSGDVAILGRAQPEVRT